MRNVTGRVSRRSEILRTWLQSRVSVSRYRRNARARHETAQPTGWFPCCLGKGAVVMSTTPIADYAVLSDRHSAALVSRDGSIDWLCWPRFDSPSIFGRLLGDEAGHWSMRAPGATEVTRRYLDRTMVLETTHRTPT